MARKAAVPGIALLAALLVGCTGGSGLGDPAEDSKPGASETTAAAAPGKYSTLPEPCGSVEPESLEQLLPGANELAPEKREKLFEGTATVTFDTDRRVGCRWRLDSVSGTRHLRIDFERVVSYDRTVSDDDRANEVFGDKQLAAGVPFAAGTSGSSAPAAPSGPSGSSASAPPSGPAATSPSSPRKTSGQDAGEPSRDTDDDTSGSPDGTPGSPSSTAGLEPRELDDLADAAFLDTGLSESGSTVKTRTVSVVFRSSNVVVTIEYAEQPGRITEVPDNKELQDRALDLAGQLAELFSD
ncbi:DUF3558 domain-containing protein [Streptomyces sp. GC420]|uniref:DUF3558 domain-containing protein n=1 Tax=Streptomyces sp. GC420 TaxID=2697568 RepID=UPI001AA1C077|nr:DUF3558 domain-containing protein [Streptomyces sp. GC420]